MNESYYEPEMVFLKNLCDIDKTSIDIGTNNGQYLPYLLELSIGVYAYEPQKIFYKKLKEKFKNKKIKLFYSAVSNKNGVTTLYLPKYLNKNLNFRGFLFTWASTENNYQKFKRKYPKFFPIIKEIKVPTVSLDKTILPKIGFIKIDVEGGEYKVLQGAKKLIKNDRPNIIIEIEERHKQNSIKNTFKFLKKLKYAGFFVLNKKIYSIKKFSINKHQSSKYLPKEQPKNDKPYIYNFVFIPKENQKKLLPQMKKTLK